MKNTFNFNAIAFIETPFSQKFGIPRQSSALSAARGTIKFAESINPANACRGLEGFSHLWLSFVFDQHIDKPWHDTVRPPRLGGNQRIGVFASRSTHRPNPIGLSLVKNEGLDDNNSLLVSGVDLLNNTPILDIKPYLDYADTAKDAHCGYAQDAPETNLSIIMDDQIRLHCQNLEQRFSDFTTLLQCVLKQDPRPAYKRQLVKDSKIYTVALYGVDISWKIEGNTVVVTKIK